MAVDQESGQFITESQAAALERLTKLAKLRGITARPAGLAPRVSQQLLVGPSGSGKTAVARRLAERLELPFLAISTPSWIVMGALARPVTLHVVRKFLEANPEGGVIAVDEIDKVTSRRTGWDQSVVTELFCLLDADARLLAMGWNQHHIDALRRCFVLGLGAWQRVAQAMRKEPTRSIGFGGKLDEAIDYASAVANDFGIPEELGLRFSDKIIVIEPPNSNDLKRGIEAIRVALKWEPLDILSLDRLVEEASTARSGVRWLETYTAELMLERGAGESVKNVPKKMAWNWEKAKVPRIRVTAAEWRHDFRRLLELVRSTPPILGRLLCRLGQVDGQIDTYGETFRLIIRGFSDDDGLLFAIREARRSAEGFGGETTREGRDRLEKDLLRALGHIAGDSDMLLLSHFNTADQLGLCIELVEARDMAKRIVLAFSFLKDVQIVEAEE